jgi:hypothetical protein
VCNTNTRNSHLPQHLDVVVLQLRSDAKDPRSCKIIFSEISYRLIEEI